MFIQIYTQGFDKSYPRNFLKYNIRDFILWIIVHAKTEIILSPVPFLKLYLHISSHIVEIDNRGHI